MPLPTTARETAVAVAALAVLVGGVVAAATLEEPTRHHQATTSPVRLTLDDAQDASRDTLVLVNAGQDPVTVVSVQLGGTTVAVNELVEAGGSVGVVVPAGKTCTPVTDLVVTVLRDGGERRTVVLTLAGTRTLTAYQAAQTQACRTFAPGESLSVGKPHGNHLDLRNQAGMPRTVVSVTGPGVTVTGTFPSTLGPGGTLTVTVRVTGCAQASGPLVVRVSDGTTVTTQQLGAAALAELVRQACGARRPVGS